VEEGGPGGKDREGGEGGEVAEKVAVRPVDFAGVAPHRVGNIADGVDGEGQQVQDDEDGGEVFLAMAEIVF
jgi:hypothetical protein